VSQLKLLVGPGRRIMLVVALVLACPSLLTTGVSAASNSSSGATVTFAEQPGSPPRYIFPMIPPAQCLVQNTQQFQFLLYRPLYWFGGPGAPGTLKMNKKQSVAYAPIYNSNDTMVTVKLKRWMWSDGVPVTATDIIFWMDLLEATKTRSCFYAPGEFPSNVTSFQAVGSDTVVFHLDASVNPAWFTNNELTEIYPIPQQMWDRTSRSDPDGNYASTPSGAVAVYNFLTAQSANPASFASNPIWQVVDGPWRLVQMTNLGFAKFVPNPHYSGSPKPRVKAFEEIPFTSGTSEFLALRDGDIDVGYLPTSDLSEKGALASKGFTASPWYEWGVNDFVENFNNPTVGPIFDQLYIRQAMQSLVNQPELISKIYHGTATSAYGPVPTAVPNSDTTSQERTNPYPYDPKHAITLLKDNGWSVNPTGTSVCVRPGSAAGECGAGIAKNASLSFNLEYAAGNASLTAEYEALKSSFGKVGITLNLTSAPLDTVYATGTKCTPSEAACSWEMVSWGYGIIYTPQDYPTGELYFLPGAGPNAGSYSNSLNNTYIRASLTSTGGLPALHTYDNYLRLQLPVIWLPLPYYQLTEITKGLHGVAPQDVFSQIYPQNWYY
jgi:peptide/nickel transport system substrate-binding protein